MEKAIERGEFVEYARVHTNMYGTSLKAVEEVNIPVGISYSVDFIDTIINTPITVTASPITAVTALITPNTATTITVTVTAPPITNITFIINTVTISMTSEL